MCTTPFVTYNECVEREENAFELEQILGELNNKSIVVVVVLVGGALFCFSPAFCLQSEDPFWFLLSLS